MAKKKKVKYMYGKSHNIQYPYKNRVFEVFSDYLDKARALSSDYRINNLFVDLRNEICQVINEIYKDLSIELKHNIKIKPGERKKLEPVVSTSNQQCEICGERRTVNLCHIIPREHGGSGHEDNLIYLCPTHHFLFDQARLSKDEFDKINVSGKAKDSIDFFMKVYVACHQMYWKYGTNKNTGCNCGSLDFDYDATVNGNIVQPCLVCRKCKLVWFFGYKHPLLAELSVEAYDIDIQITEQDKQKYIDNAKQVVRERIVEKNLSLVSRFGDSA